MSPVRAVATLWSSRAARWALAAALAVLAVWLGPRLVARGHRGPVYRTERLARGPVVATVTATGTLNAVTTVQVGSQLSGMIQSLRADFNSTVKRDQLLAEIDPATFAAAVAQAEADVDAAAAAVSVAEHDLTILDAAVAQARAAVETAKAQVRRAEAAARDKQQILARLVALGPLTSKQDRDTADANRATAGAELDAAQATADQEQTRLASAVAQRSSGDAKLAQVRAQLAQRRATLALARVSLARTRILSPIDGVVVSRNVDVGQTVAASLQAPVLFTIANDLTRMQIDAAVDEADIGRVRVGQRVDFTVDAYPEEKFTGTVVQVRLQPVISQNVVTYDTVIEVANPRLLLRPGMTANVAIEIARTSDALRLPNAALSYRPASAPAADAAPRGIRLVYREGPAGPVPVSIAIGIADSGFTAVVSGALAAGDRVIVGEGSDAKDAGAGPTNPFAPRRR